MTRYFFLILLSFFVSCKKEQPKGIAVLSTSPSNPILQTKKLKIKIDNSILSYHNNKSLNKLYTPTDYQTVWKSKRNREIVLEHLNKSEEEGLNPADYNVTKLGVFEKKFASLSSQELVNYDILLSQSFQKYISHLTNGKLNPRKLYTNWDLKKNKIDIDKTTVQLLKSDALAEKIEQLKPRHFVYKKLKKALALINALPKDQFKTIIITDLIFPNDSNPLLTDIKKKLIYWKDLQPKDSLTLIYDNETVEAVKKFQKRHGLAPDGIIGPITTGSLNFSKKQRKEQIISNLERWKWFPREMGNEYVIINIPDYRLTLVKNQDTLRIHKVIVGRPKRKTPVLSSKLTQVIFNPTWTVPPTIIREDLIPDALRNRNYFTKMSIRIYDKNGNIVSPRNWQLSKAQSYRYVQVPGVFNSLGMVKLVFPNRFLIYLHDTNHRDFFEKIDRSLSSGCVRVDNPLELTEYLLHDATNWNLEKITETLQNEKTKEVKIKKTIYFHLLYWTAWSEKNELVFRDDIYNLDADLYRQLRN
jgi:murein L,D-transpeptidase YcbB/YkuD